MTSRGIMQLLQEYAENLLPFDGTVYYKSSFYSKEESDSFLSRFTNEIAWKHEPIKIFGKEVLQPRLTAWFGKTYGYSGIKLLSAPFPDLVLTIKEKVEATTGLDFNSVLMNHYRDGNDSMGWHRDNEKILGPDPAIASVTFGVVRKFRFRNYINKSIGTDIELAHGSLLLMLGKTQHHWQHAVFKTKQDVSPRINLTFRHIPDKCCN